MFRSRGMAQLPCWLPRGQQVSQQRGIWGFHCTQVTKHVSVDIHPSFKTQSRRHQKSKTGISVDPQKVSTMTIPLAVDEKLTLHVNTPLHWITVSISTTFLPGSLNTWMLHECRHRAEDTSKLRENVRSINLSRSSETQTKAKVEIISKFRLILLHLVFI